MELKLKRKWRTDQSTIGELSLNGNLICYILEDRDRGLKQSMSLSQILKIKVKHQTCIPAGRYEIVITYSQRFKRDLPLLLNVPGYDGIRIHTGNTDLDTSGCLLPGKTLSINKVSNSTTAFNELFELLKTSLKTQKVFITIE